MDNIITKKCCKRGHEYTGKQCGICISIWKEAHPEYALNYYKDNKSKFKEYYQRDKEKYAARYKENKDKIAVYSKAYRAVHKDKAREAAKDWRSKNIEKARSYCKTEAARARAKLYSQSEHGKEVIRKYQQTEASKARGRLYLKSESGRIAHINSRHRRRSLLKDAGRFTVKEWHDLCTATGNKCLWCGEAVKLTADHIVPISRDGMNTIDNIQPLCKPCNSKKGTKILSFLKTEI